MVNQHNVMIIGTLPTTGGVGGVTVHVERLIGYLDKEHIPYKLFDYKVEPLMQFFKKMRGTSIIHSHVSNAYLMFIIAVFCSLFRKKLIVTLHGKYTKGCRKPWSLISFYIRKATVPIVLNETSYNTCLMYNNNTLLIPAFIPPQKEEKLEKKDLDQINNIREQGKKIAVTYGYDVVFENDGREIYGIDFLINFFKDNKEYSLIVSDPSGNYKKKYFGLSNIHFIDHPHSLYSLIKKTDVFIRNTSKDGDSLSVKEALYLEKRVLCSDVVERPKGVELFGYCNEKLLRECLYGSRKSNSANIESGEKKIVELYRSLL